jgi:hypothetical protein
MNVLDSMELSDIPIPSPSSFVKRDEKSKKMILIASRDLEREELDLLLFYGKILVYDDCHINIPLEQIVTHDIQYILFDVRKKSHRMGLASETSDQFHRVAIGHKWQEMDDFVDDANCENFISSLPPKQAFKKDFDKLLLEKKIRKPSCMKNTFRVIFRAMGGWQKD